MDPRSAAAELIERLRAEVEKAPGGPTYRQGAARSGIDPSTARRQFKRHYGMTFQAYHRARRMGLALREVRKGGRVEEAQNGSGFESASGFREAFTAIFGESPTDGERTRCLSCRAHRHATRRDDRSRGRRGLATAGVRRSPRAGARIEILRKRFAHDVVPGEHQHLDAIRTRARRLFRRDAHGLSTMPLAPVGSDFQLRTWRNCCTRFHRRRRARIPGWRNNWESPEHAAQSAGQTARTCFALSFPCHRVIRADGTLCGYGGGLWRKKWLLEHERKMAAR